MKVVGFNMMKQRRNKRSSDTTVLLEIIGNRKSKEISARNKMQTNNVSGFDILRTRRFIINDNVSNQQQPVATPFNYQFILNNMNQIQKPESCVVQFSNTILTEPTCSRPSPPSFQNHQPNSLQYSPRSALVNMHNEMPNFFSNNFKTHRKESMIDDDVVCLSSTKGDKSIILDSEDTKHITIGSGGCYDPNNSVIVLDSPDDTPDLSRFEIVISNTDCKVSEQNDVISIEPENNHMECTSSVPNKDELTNSSIITIDDDSDRSLVELPRRRLETPKTTKSHVIHKKKDQYQSNRKYITFTNDKLLSEALDVLTTPDLAPDILPISKAPESEPTKNMPPTKNDSSTKNASNMYNFEQISKIGLREVIIDGSNVALGHTHGTSYSIEGLQIVIDYFVKRGHKVRAFVPQFRIIPGRSTNPALLRQLVKDKHVVLTPSRAVMGRRITPYDDRFIIQYATMCEGIIVSSDCYRDLINEKPEWRNTIENRLLMPTWIENVLMFPDDPLGRFGPSLTEFLKFPDP